MLFGLIFGLYTSSCQAKNVILLKND